MRCRGLRGTGWSRRPLAPSPSTLELAQQGQPGEVEGDVGGGGSGYDDCHDDCHDDYHDDCHDDCRDDCHDDVSDEVIINLVEGQLELAGLVRRRKPDKDTLRSGISGQ